MRLDNAYYIYPSEYEYRSSEKCSRDEEMSPFEIDKFHKFQRVVTRNDRRLSHTNRSILIVGIFFSTIDTSDFTLESVSCRIRFVAR